MKPLTSIVSLIFCPLFLWSQTTPQIIQTFLNQHYQEQHLTQQDISQWSITSQHQSSISHIDYVYIQQEYQGLKIANGIANFTLKEGKVWSMNNQLVANLQQKAPTNIPSISPLQAIQYAAQQLGLSPPHTLKQLKKTAAQHFLYHKGDISIEDIPVQLMYYATTAARLNLVWDLSIYQLDAQHWWSVKIDAQTGKLLDKKDWVTHCQFEHHTTSFCPRPNIKKQASTHCSHPSIIAQPDQYTVFALPTESPNHGTRTTVTNPANVLASPYGWHDTNAVAGPEFTITKGNNVYAYDDSLAINTPGSSPDGGNALEFNFAYYPTLLPSFSKAAAITNLFYTCNMAHDIFYHHGFDEASGNFQSNNYGNGGLGGDYLLAEAQDGGGSNNASFAVIGDGTSPRMQVFLWNINSGHHLTINSPSAITGTYYAGQSHLGPSLSTVPIMGNLVLVEDNIPPIHNGCEPIINTVVVNGQIAIINDDPYCSTKDKIEAAQNAGAIAVVIISEFHSPTHHISGSSSTITIPSIRISKADGDLIKAQMALGTVNASLHANSSPLVPEDGDFDNGLILHEYGHGVSSRLIGGAANPNCLDSAKHMGEGWSDWFALMLTIEPGDLATDPRGIATYAARQATGIRPAPYTTDTSINSYTYGASNNTTLLSDPHGIGFIYATVLWDLTWALIDYYGGSPNFNLYDSTGGNNIAMDLVLESLKSIKCNPGMVDGRNAMLNADSLLYQGRHQCLIWEVFAARGLGYYASQGSISSKTDQVEDFSLPPTCQTDPPRANFGYSSNSPCAQTVYFTDSSTYINPTWQWYFGDGDSSNLQEPIHTYDSIGIYTVLLVVSDSFSRDSIAQDIVITTPETPAIQDIEICSGDTAYFMANHPAIGTIQWKNANQQIIHTGDTLMIPPNGTSPQTYYAQRVVTAASQYIGPSNANIGLKAYTPAAYYFRMLNFRADQALDIVTAWVRSSRAFSATFYLVKGHNTDGSPPSAADIVEQRVINLPAGSGRITLNFSVPDSGLYCIGSSNSDLRYNRTGAQYPYTLGEYMTIQSSSDLNNPLQYYFILYDLEIRDPLCLSEMDTVELSTIGSDFTYNTSSGTVAFSNNSTGAYNWHWDFGDNNTSNLPNPVHTYTTAGNYTVSLSINDSSCTSNQTISIVLSTDPLQKKIPQVTLAPNPAHQESTLILSKAFSEDLEIQLVDVSGKIVQTQVLRAGKTQLTIDLSTLDTAVYWLRIKGETWIDFCKLIVY